METLAQVMKVLDDARERRERDYDPDKGRFFAVGRKVYERQPEAASTAA